MRVTGPVSHQSAPLIVMPWRTSPGLSGPTRLGEGGGADRQTMAKSERGPGSHRVAQSPAAASHRAPVGPTRGPTHPSDHMHVGATTAWEELCRKIVKLFRASSLATPTTLNAIIES